MVAKSYQNKKIIGEPYNSNGKMYVDIETKPGTVKAVRWYTDAEYKKMYPTEVIVDHSKDPFWKSQKEVLGFKNGFITIFKGDTYPHKDWFKEQGAVYRKWWGWGIASTDEVPAVLPYGVEAVRLPWESVGTELGVLKKDEEVQKAIEELLYDAGLSEYVGDVGDKLELTLTVTKMVILNSYYGESCMHIMTDDCENEYVWTTTAKRWEEGEVHHIKGTVKDHKMYRNKKQTILTRCKEVE